MGFCAPAMAFERREFAIFVVEMKRTTLIILYWSVALVLFAIVLSSTGYTFAEALFLASSLLPVAVLFRYLLVQVRFSSRWQGIRNVCFLTLFILTLAFLAVQLFATELGVSPILLNPIFLLAMLLLIIAGDYFFEQLIREHLPESEESITFNSDRQSVKLQRKEILYIESCDTETWIYATEGRRYRNKRSISAWANLLGRDFIRIHRSYLVRISACQGREGENILIGDARLPISRKYKVEVLQTVSER